MTLLLSNYCTRLSHIYWGLCQSTLMTAHSDKNYSSGKPFDQKRSINWLYSTIILYESIIFTILQLSKVCEDFVVMILGAGLSVSQSLSVDSLLPHTSPRAPVLCMLPPTSPAASLAASSASASHNPVALLEAAAAQMKRNFLSFALLDEDHSDELMVELSQLAREGSWVVVEHCQLYSKWRKALQQIMMVRTYTLK